MNISTCVYFFINIITKSLSHSLHVPLPSLSNEIEMKLKCTTLHTQLKCSVLITTQNIRLLVVKSSNELYRKYKTLNTKEDDDDDDSADHSESRTFN